MTTNPIIDAIRQRDLVPAVTIIAQASGWLVVNLHGNKINPGQTSLPDLMLTRDNEPPVLVKCLGPKGEVTAKQQQMLTHYTTCGFRTLSCRPQDIGTVVSFLAPLT